MAKEALEEGKCVVVGLQSTGEASQEAALEVMEVRVGWRTAGRKGSMLSGAGRQREGGVAPHTPL